ncbi:cyanophycin synthetase [Alloiococcus sp. CFN-8]|uniref:cyanophycin synthetase n=1 Tax=Alloiococcus sp. CFN-8 TaxID=3416081 RepID=UPI003CEEC0E2
MKILDYKFYEGRNIYSHKKCVKLIVNLEGYKDIPSVEIDNFNFNLLSILPELKEHRCGIDEDGGFVTRLTEGTYLAHICEHSIIAIHNRLGIDVCYGKARVIKDDIYYIIFSYRYKKTALAIANLAVELMNSLIKNIPLNISDKLNYIKGIVREEMMGSTTEAICNAAIKRGLPIIPIGNSGFFQIGYGKYGRIVEASISTDTSCVAVDISCDKSLTKLLLRQQWIPVPEGEVIKDSIQLLALAEEIGYPVVLKPQYGSKGKGVHLNIKNDIELLKSYSSIKEDFSEFILEKYYQGKDFRVCVIDYKVVAVALRLPPFVTGDGQHTIRELIDLLNEDYRRGEDHEKPLTVVKIDSTLIQCIFHKGYVLDNILENGTILYLRENGNLSTGGVAIDYTDKIAPQNIELCVRAAKTLGLDICGIDICCEDISIPLEEQDGVILEVNSAPGLRMHHYPYIGEARDAAGAVIDMLFKEGLRNIPVIAITGTNGKTTTTRLIGHTISVMGYNVGITTTDGIYINKKCIAKGDTTGYESAKTILLNKDVEVAVLETARGGIIHKGLAYDLADVAVLTNISDDHLGIDDVNTLDELSSVKSLVLEAVKPEGYAVINGDDPWSVRLLSKLNSNIIITARDRNNSYLVANLNKGGYGVYIDHGNICVEKENKVFRVCSIKDIPITYNGLLSYNIENSMAATAALVGAGVDYCVIKKGLCTFMGDEVDNPGRFNIHDFGKYKIVLDYGHNVEGYKAVLGSLAKLPHNKLIGVIGVPGDRLDSNVELIGKISSDALDYIIIKEDMDKRGRAVGEVAALIEKGLKENNFKDYEIYLDEIDALSRACSIAEEGDVIVIFFEEYSRVKDYVANHKVFTEDKKENII